jgi:Trypsin-co-occurring domain 2
MTHQIRLSKAIENLREELKLAQEMGKTDRLKFNITSIDLELEVTAEHEKDFEGKATGKVQWFVELAGSATAKNKDVSKHKLKLTLQAIEHKDDGTPQQVQVSGTATRGAR